MSVFQKKLVYLFLFLLTLTGNTRAESPRIGSPYAQMRTEPLFGAPTLTLAKTWGPTIPVGTEFQVEKVYGRWLYGRPSPLAKMKPKDFAPSGWLFSRQLIAPGDENILSTSSAKLIFSAIQYTEIFKKELQLTSSTETPKINLLESLVLSKKTLDLFIKTDELANNTSYRFPIITVFPQAYAKDSSSLGLSGPSLEFLDFEIHEIQTEKKVSAAKRKAQILMPPSLQPVNQKIHTRMLAKATLAREYTLPPLTQEEVDGHSYMNAIAHRALQGCSKEIQSYWKESPFRFFRVYKNNDDQSSNHWISERVGGGYFAVSAFTIEALTNEAELAFLLVRLLVQSAESHPKEVVFSKSHWKKNLQDSLKKQKSLLEENNDFSTMKNYDVGNEAHIDKTAIHCLKNSGYSYLSAINFLTRLKQNKSDEKFRAFWKAGLGYDYRLDKLKELQAELVQANGNGKILVSNSKRFGRATKNWNLVP